MVRRSTVDRSPQSGVYGGRYEAEAEHPEPGRAARVDEILNLGVRQLGAELAKLLLDRVAEHP